MPARAIIFANGQLQDFELVRRIIQPGDTILAADGGTRHALALGLKPSVVIGDLDSLPDADHRLLEREGAEIRRHPRDKDETDLELALRYAVEIGHHRIVIVAALGGRLDQTLGNLSLLTAYLTSTQPGSGQAFDIRLDDGVEEAFFIRNSSNVHGSPGDIISLLPWGGEVTGVTTDGMRWLLHGETLYPDKTRGISNELLDPVASISIQSGLLLVVHRRQS